MNKSLLAIILLLLAALGVGAFVGIRLWSDQKLAPKNSQISQISPTPSTPSQSPSVKIVAYTKDDSLWLINSDGTGKVKVSDSYGKPTGPMTWKDHHALSYVSCDKTCSIRTAIMQSENAPEIPDTENQILALAWNHAGNKMAYLYKLPDGQMKLNLKSGSVDNTIKNFFAGLGRGGSLDDDVSISFSPDDKHILITNTMTVGNPQNKNTIWALDQTGKELTSLAASGSAWPTQANWLDSETFVYKDGPSLYHEDIDDTIRFFPNASIPNFYNPTTFNNEEVYYWVNTKDLPYIGALNSSGKTTKLMEGYFKPVRISDHIIALKAGEASSDESLLPFKSIGLSSIDAQNNTKDLDVGEIETFAVSP